MHCNGWMEHKKQNIGLKLKPMTGTAGQGCVSGDQSE